MTPLNLRERPPRDPRVRLGGLMMLARTVDKARAALPGGEPGQYFITPGLSAWLLARLKLTETEFLELVRLAENDDAVVAALAGILLPERCERVNAFLESLRVQDTTPELREPFVRLYGSQPADALIIDVLTADDRAMFSGSTA